jgi:hypothetical protein
VIETQAVETTYLQISFCLDLTAGLDMLCKKPQSYSTNDIS